MNKESNIFKNIISVLLALLVLGLAAGTATPAPAPTKKVPGFELVPVAAALCSVYLFGRKRR